MAKSSRRSKQKEIKPTFFVFCEGESEEAYISFVKSMYRIPIQIRSKVAKNKINNKYVQRILGQIPKHVKDKCFLLYDFDVPEVVERLLSIQHAILLASNPCIELWYILHTCNHTAESTSTECVSQLERICKDYKKGFICDKLKNELKTGVEHALKRSKKLSLFNNPSTSVYLLIEELIKISR
jgi:hypothetical protein